jgi:hypothetical protein
VAIIGGGIGGVALAVACLHRGFRLPFTNAITASKLDLVGYHFATSVKQSKDWVFSLEMGNGNEKMDAVRGKKISKANHTYRNLCALHC